MSRAAGFLLLVVAVGSVALAGRAAPVNAAGPPVLLGIAPDLAYAGTDDFVVTLWGHNFEPTTVIEWDGGALTTTFVNQGEIFATVAAAEVASVGTAQLTAETPGQGTSAGVAFNVIAGPPAPYNSIRLSPSSVGTLATTRFLVQGVGAHPAMTLEVGGVPLSYRMLGPTMILTEPFTAPGTTGSINFITRTGTQTINSSVQVQAPQATTSLSGIVPATVKAGGPGFLLSVEVIGSIQGGATVVINNQDMQTFHQDGHRLLAYVPAAIITNAVVHEVKVRTSAGNLSDSRNLTVSATGLTSPPFLQPFQGVNVRADGRSFQLHIGASFSGPNAYVTWNGTPVRTTLMGQGLILSLPGSLLTTSGPASLLLHNPPPIGTTQAQPTMFPVYDTADGDCDGDVDGADVMIILQLLVNQQVPNVCHPYNPDNDPLSQRNLADALFTARKVANLP